MQHTLLFQEGVWAAKGTFTDDRKRRLPAEGATKVIHAKEEWLLEGHMKLLGDEPKELQSRCVLAPFPPGGNATNWKSINPDLGMLAGRFAVVEDTIISVYWSENAEISGVECLRQVSETRYSVKGVLYRKGEILSSWSVELTRSDEAG